jgi:hypothetical protein
MRPLILFEAIVLLGVAAALWLLVIKIRERSPGASCGRRSAGATPRHLPARRAPESGH